MASVESVSRRAAMLLTGVSDVLTFRQNKLWSSAALGAFVLLACYYSGNKDKKPLESALITDPSKVARRVKANQQEYDEDEYDVIIVGGGELWLRYDATCPS